MYLGEAAVSQSALSKLIRAAEKLKIRGLAGADSVGQLERDNQQMILACDLQKRITDATDILKNHSSKEKFLNSPKCEANSALRTGSREECGKDVLSSGSSDRDLNNVHAIKNETLPAGNPNYDSAPEAEDTVDGGSGEQLREDSHNTHELNEEMDRVEKEKQDNSSVKRKSETDSDAMVSKRAKPDKQQCDADTSPSNFLSLLAVSVVEY